MKQPEVQPERIAPDALSSSISVTRPYVYLILTVLALMAAVLIGWTFWGHVPEGSLSGFLFEKH